MNDFMISELNIQTYFGDIKVTAKESLFIFAVDFQARSVDLFSLCFFYQLQHRQYIDTEHR